MLRLQGPRQPIWQVLFAPDSRTLVVVGTRDVRAWEGARLVRSIPAKGEKAATRLAAFTPAGTLLLLDRHGEEVRVSDVETGRAWELLGGVGRQVWAWTVSADGERVVTAGQKRMFHTDLLCWRLRTGRPSWHIPISRGEENYAVRVQQQILALAFSPDSSLLATRHRGGVRLWEAATGTSLGSAIELSGEAAGLAFAPDGEAVAGLVPTGVVLLSLSGRVLGTLEVPRVAAVAFHPGGRLLATAGNDGAVRFWDVAELRQRAEFAWEIGRVRRIAFSPDGAMCCCGGDRGAIVVWDVDEN